MQYLVDGMMLVFNSLFCRWLFALAWTGNQINHWFWVVVCVTLLQPINQILSEPVFIRNNDTHKSICHLASSWISGQRSPSVPELRLDLHTVRLKFEIHHSFCTSALSCHKPDLFFSLSTFRVQNLPHSSVCFPALHLCSVVAGYQGHYGEVGFTCQVTRSENEEGRERSYFSVLKFQHK